MKLPILYLSSFEKEQIVPFNDILAKIVNAINGIEFGDGVTNENIWCDFQSVITPASPDTEFAINHNLRRVPIGTWLIRKKQATDIYDDDTCTEWTSSTIYVKCNTASASGTVIII